MASNKSAVHVHYCMKIVRFVRKVRDFEGSCHNIYDHYKFGISITTGNDDMVAKSCNFLYGEAIQNLKWHKQFLVLQNLLLEELII